MLPLEIRKYLYDIQQACELLNDFTAVQVHICLANTSGSNLVQGVWELYAKWSRHIAEYSPAMW